MTSALKGNLGRQTCTQSMLQGISRFCPRTNPMQQLMFAWRAASRLVIQWWIRELFWCKLWTTTPVYCIGLLPEPTGLSSALLCLTYTTSKVCWQWWESLSLQDDAENVSWFVTTSQDSTCRHLGRLYSACSRTQKPNRYSQTIGTGSRSCLNHLRHYIGLQHHCKKTKKMWKNECRSFGFSKLDCCNSLLSGRPNKPLKTLQLNHNAS